MIFRTPGDLSAHFLGVVNEDELWWCVVCFLFFFLVCVVCGVFLKLLLDHFSFE